MSDMRKDQNEMPEQPSEEELEQLLRGNIHLPQEQDLSRAVPQASRNIDEEEDTEVLANTDVQGALGLFAEASQDMATASLELGLGRHFACADYCNQVAEKAAQAVSLLRFGRRSIYNHDLRALGATVGAPLEIQNEMETLTPFHPEAFYAETPPEEADEIISAEQASSYVQRARKVLKWARSIVLIL